MISIPDQIKVTRAKSSEKMLLDKSRDWLGSSTRTPGIHASHLLDLRQAYWQIKHPLPLSDRLVTMFLVGKVLHGFVLGAVDGVVDLKVTDEGSKHSDILDLDYSPDKYITRKGNKIVAEFKTSRSFYAPDSVEDLSIYIEQVLIYMAAEAVTEAEVWVLYLNLKEEGRTHPQFRCYRLSLTAEELDATTMWLKREKLRLTQALDSNDFQALPLCRDFKCGRGNCEYFDDCKPEGRYGSGLKKWGDGEADQVPSKRRS